MIPEWFIAYMERLFYMQHTIDRSVQVWFQMLSLTCMLLPTWYVVSDLVTDRVLRSTQGINDY
jgi:hypothetical protein